MTSSSDTSAALESVDEHMQSAKRKFTAATLACIKGMPTAERQVAEALAEIEAAQRRVRALSTPSRIRRPEMSTPADALAVAEMQVHAIKHRISLAALACLRGAPDHAQQVAKALEAVDTASDALRALKAMLAPEPHREDARASEGAEPAMTSE